MKRITLILACLLIWNFNYGQKLCPIIPKPAQFSFGKGKFVINEKTSISAESNLSSSVEQLRKMLFNTGFAFPLSQTVSNVIVLKIDSTLKNLTDEGYRLNVDNKRIEIVASDPKGLYYGFVSLTQLLPAEIYGKTKPSAMKWELPAISIEDQPRFVWRAVMLDVSRQFFDFEFLLKYVDWMALHKINVFHIHLADDPGWRIEIKKYPELTNKGAWRGENEVLRPSHGSGKARYGGFYTQEQLKELVRYALERNVQILPEIDMPGHSKAVVASYPEVLCVPVNGEASKSNVYCASKESNFTMIEDIIAELAAIFPFEYIHIGGDEVNYNYWENCVNCKKLMKDENFTEVANVQNYFVKRLEEIVNKQGKKMIGWNEIMHGGELRKTTAVMSWEGIGPGYEAAKKGYPVVMSPQTHTYLDKRQSKDERGWSGDIVTTEKVYSFEPLENNTLSKNELKNIFGVEACLWSELLDKPARFADYQTYPRLCALAEVGWSPLEKRDWNDFSNRMWKYHFSRMNVLDINYRLFSPSAKATKNTVTITPPYSNAIVRYTLDGSEPNEKSTRYEKPFVAPNINIVWLKTFAKNGRTSPTMKGLEREPVTHWTPENCDTAMHLVDFDISNGIDSEGNWLVDLIFQKGTCKIVIQSVKLIENGTQIAEDIHEGSSGSWHKNNSYNLPIPSYRKGNKYTLRVSFYSAGGTDSYGNIVLWNNGVTKPIKK